MFAEDLFQGAILSFEARWAIRSSWEVCSQERKLDLSGWNCQGSQRAESLAGLCQTAETLFQVQIPGLSLTSWVHFEQVTQPLQALVSSSVKCGVLWVTVEMGATHCTKSTWQMPGTSGDSRKGGLLFLGRGLFFEETGYSLFFVFNVYLFWRDTMRERDREQGRCRERDTHTHTIWSRLQVLSCLHRAQRGAWTHQPHDHDLKRSQSLNWQPLRRRQAGYSNWTFQTNSVLIPLLWKSPLCI